MAKSKFAKRYPKEFRHQMVELHRAGRTLTDLSRQFGPTPWAISLWVKQADRDEGRGVDEGKPGPLSGERHVPVAWGLRRKGSIEGTIDLKSGRARGDVELTALLHQIHERSYHGAYGAPRIHMELRGTYGIRVGRKRIVRLMRQAGLKGVQKRRFQRTTRPGAPERFAPDLVQRHFTANRPNALWLAVFSRYVVGWAKDARLSSQLVLAALEMAYAQRCPDEIYPSFRPRW